MRVIITGSHGLIGTALRASLERDGHLVTRLVRQPPSGAGQVRWDPVAGTIDAAALEGHDAVVNLAGAGVGDKRWTPARREVVMGSRVASTRLLSRTLADLVQPPAVLASASGINYYGDRGDEEVTEASPPGSGFLTDVTLAWEAATEPAEAAGIRVAHLRNGVVLARHGGALKSLLTPFRLGVGGPIGRGRQWWSWISLADEVAAIRHVLTDGTIQGPVNLTAPAPVRQRDFAKALGRALHRPAVLPLPAPAMKAILGADMAREMVLTGARVRPAVLERSGYLFLHPTIDEGLAAALVTDGRLGRP